MRHLPKLALTWLICFGLRLIPFRPANAEPLMATLMPQGSRFGMLTNLLWLVSEIVAYDAATVGIGSWTWEVALVYGVIAVAAVPVFRRGPSRVKYVSFAILSTLSFDFLTGIVFGPALRGQSLSLAIAGQIPFTIAHLAGNFLLAAFVSPIIQRWIVDNPYLELAPISDNKKVTA
jgi:hypothetical protein